MRKVLFTLLITLSLNSFADEVKCFSDERIIYQSKHVYDVVLVDDGYFFTESISNKKVFMPFDCIVKFYD